MTTDVRNKTSATIVWKNDNIINYYCIIKNKVKHTDDTEDKRIKLSICQKQEMTVTHKI